MYHSGLPWWPRQKNLPAMWGLYPGLGRAPGERVGNPLEYSCLENSMDRGAWGGYSPLGHKELGMIEQLTLSLLASSLPPEFSSGPRRVCTVEYLSKPLFQLPAPKIHLICCSQIENIQFSSVLFIHSVMTNSL